MKDLKNYLILATSALFILGMCACKGKDRLPDGTGNYLLILKSDYTTNALEGISESPARSLAYGSSLDIRVTEEPLGDSILLNFLLGGTSDTIFTASMGNSIEGQIRKPIFLPASQWAKSDVLIQAPQPGTIQLLNDNSSWGIAPNVEELWKDIGVLKRIRDYQFAGPIAIYLYKPDTNPANSKAWKWIWVLYKPQILME